MSEALFASLCSQPLQQHGGSSSSSRQRGGKVRVEEVRELMLGGDRDKIADLEDRMTPDIIA